MKLPLLVLIPVGLAAAMLLVGWLATRLVRGGNPRDPQEEADLEQFFRHQDRKQDRAPRRVA